MCRCWCGVSGWCVPCCSGGASCTNTTQVLCWAHGTVQPLSTLYLHYLHYIYTIYIQEEREGMGPGGQLQLHQTKDTYDSLAQFLHHDRRVLRYYAHSPLPE